MRIKGIWMALAAALAVAMPSLVRGGERFLSPWSLYYLDGDPMFEMTTMVSPSGMGFLTFASGTNYTFTATPPAGHKVDGWRLATQQAATSAMSLDALSALDSFDGATVQFSWVSRYGNDTNPSVQYYYLAPCFSWLEWKLAYRGNHSSIPSDYGTTSLIYTDSVTVANATNLWNVTRTGYDITGWSLTADGAVQYKPGDTIANAGEAFGVTEDGETIYLYAVWEKREMAISLDAQGGNVASNSVIARIEEKYSLPTPTREGFTFDGWYTAEAAGSKITDGVTVVERDDITTLYAHWTELRLNLSYDWNWSEGTGAAPATQHYGYTDSATLSAGPESWSRTGYDFMGWATNDATVALFAPGQTLSPVGRALGISESRLSVTLFGVWKLREMTIALDAQGGDVATSSISVHVGGSYSLPTPTREGFTFDGWYTAVSEGQKIENTSLVERDDIATLYAHWTLITYRLSYDWNWEFAPAAPAATEYGYTNTVTLLAAPTWPRIGYDFLGWAYSDAATEADFNAGEELKNSGGRFGVAYNMRAVALYGVWEKRNMKIALDVQGGNVSSNSVTVRIEETYPLPTPTRDGFIFEGWFTDLTGGDRIADGDVVERDDIFTLYAHWKLIEFTMAYDQNLPSPAESQWMGEICGWTNTLEISALPSGWERPGWEFLGWARASDCEFHEFPVGLPIDNIGRVFDVVDGSTNTLFAVWNLKKMAIALDAEGNMAYSNDFCASVSDTFAAPPTQIVVTVETTYRPLPDLVRRDAWFDGWFTAIDGGDMITNGQSVVRDDISALYAHWTPKKIFNVALEFRDSAGQPTNETQTVFEKDSAVMPELDVVDAWIGHTFLRWEPEEYSCIEADADFAAVYKTNTYDIAFDANGGQGWMDDIKGVLYDVETNLTANAFRRGKTDAWGFGGWALDDDPNTIVFTDGQAVTNLTAVDGAKVYLNAVWVSKLTEFSEAVNSDVLLTPDTNKWVNTDDLSGIVADNDSKWYVTNIIEVISNDVEGVAVFTTNFIPVIATSSSTIFLNSRTELRGSVYGKGLLSFEWGANYDTDIMDPDKYWFTVKEESTEVEKITDLLRCNVWPTSNNFQRVEVPLANDVAHEISWSLPFLGTKGQTFYLRNITWVPEGQFTVSFDGNGGEGSMDSMEFFLGEYGTLPRNTFTLTGYTFANWMCEYEYDSVTYQKTFEDRETTAWMTNDTTLVAQWVANKYFIRFGANGGEGKMKDQEIEYDAEEALDANTFTRTGYTFINWLFDGVEYPDCAVVTNLTTEADAILDFTAQWEAHNYTANFDANGGVGDALAPIPCTYDEPWALPENPFVRTGYTFAGWKLGEDVFAPGDVVSNLTAEDDGEVTFVAVWTPNEFMVEFSGGDDASGTMFGIAFTYDRPRPLPANLFTRIGYSFGGWTFGEEAFDDCAVVSNLVADVAGIAVLNANWLPHTFTVRFDASDGLGSMSSSGFVYGEATSLPHCSFYRIGYAFAGWSFGDEVFEDGQAISNLTAMANGEVTLTATWTPIEYTVEFDGGASDVTGEMQPITFKYDTEANLPSNAFERVGYTFVQWKAGEKTFEDGALVTNLATEADVVVTLTAEWLAHEYSVVFVANGGEGEMDGGVFTYGEATALALNSFTRTGYKFIGWALREDGDVVYGDGAEISNLAADDGAEVSLFAIWQPISYVVRFDANGGEGEMDDFAMTYDEAADLPFYLFTRTGFEFVCWESEGVEYSDGAEVINLASVEGAVVVFTAKWVENSITPAPDETEEDVPAPVERSGEMFPAGEQETGEFTATANATYNGWLRDTSGRIAALISVKTTAVKRSGAVSRSTIKVTPFIGKKATYKTTIVPGANPVDEFGIVYGAFGLSGKFQGYAVEAALDYSKAKAGTAERAIANLLPTGVWTAAFETKLGYVTFSATVSKKGKAKVTGYLEDGSRVSISAQGILGANNVFAIPVMNARKGVGFVLWVSENGAVEISDCTNSAWTPVAQSSIANLKDGKYALSFSMPTWRSYIAATDVGGVNVTPIGEASLSVAGGKWSVAKSVGKVAVVKGSAPAQTYVKIKDGLVPANLASLKLNYTAKTGAAKGSFKLWYLQDGKLRSDKVTVTGTAVAGRFFASAIVKKLGVFKILIGDE